MPTYQYSCTECGEALEVQQSFSDDPLTVCPVCQGRLRKVYNAVGVVFKGSGFYRTDSRAGKGSGASESSSSSTPATTSKPSTSESTSSSSSTTSGAASSAG
ncbi:MAG TPA: FmdB family zinc ribbon protein [Aeromicrobium sp.]|nr:FmdB family zinc ribbon protein [Aeromicrobium sp.]HKY58853.1 FmdB family zinc ribbon protein [Aeromicrobium sp.]